MGKVKKKKNFFDKLFRNIVMRNLYWIALYNNLALKLKYHKKLKDLKLKGIDKSTRISIVLINYPICINLKNIKISWKKTSKMNMPVIINNKYRPFYSTEKLMNALNLCEIIKGFMGYISFEDSKELNK